MRWKNILALTNPRAGRLGSEHGVAALLTALCAREQTRLTTRTVVGAMDATVWAEHARVEGFDLVVVVGGDGTVNATIAGLLRGGVLPVAIIPTGSGNILARDLGIPFASEDAVALLSAGRTRAVDIGHVVSHDQYLLNAAAVGFGAKIFDDAHTHLKSFLGYPAYALTALKNVIRVPTAQFTLTLDGSVQQVEAQMIVVANTNVANMRMVNLGPTVHCDDGLLDVILFPHSTFLNIIQIVAGMMFHPHTPLPQLTYLQARTIRIDATPTLPVSVDGEPSQNTPVEITTLHNALEIIVPTE